MIRQPIVTICGHVDHGKCVSDDTLIPLVDGTILTAKELFENNFESVKAERIDDGFLQSINSKSIEVFSFDGKKIIAKPISHIWKRKAEKLIEIRLSSGDVIKTTPEHPFFTFNLSSLREIRADTLTEGQYIAIPKKIKTYDFDVEEQIAKKIKNIDNCVCFLNTNSGKLIDLLKEKDTAELERNLNINNIRDSTKKLRFRIKDFFKLCSNFDIDDKDAYSMIESIKNANEGWRVGHTSNKIFLPKQGYEEKLGYLLGVLAGDGYISKNVILNNNDFEIQQAYSVYLKQIFGTDSKIKRGHTCKIVLDSGGLTFARFLTEIVGFPKKNKSGEIFVPEIAKQNKEVFKGFFSGLFDTDGYASHLNNCIEITSKSKKLIKESSILLLNFGVQSVVYEKNGFYVLRIANKIYIELFLHFFNPRLQRKKERILNALEKAQSSRIFDFFPLNGNILKGLEVLGKINTKVSYFSKYQKSSSLSSLFLNQIIKNIKQENQISVLIKQLLEQEISYVKVISKKETPNSHGWVYDFTIPDTHNFVAERVLVHNTSLLDSIRGSCVAEKEAGLITQKISFTSFPSEYIEKRCELMRGKLKIPGFLFIDTPGHAAFTNLRKRGGSLADIAVLVVDINEGIMPQTKEVIQILKAGKTPFVIALNKIDRISGWKKQSENMKENIEQQAIHTKELFDEKLYTFMSALNFQGFDGELFYNINDFTKKIALIPCSAKTKEGLKDLLATLCGLSQKFLEKRLEVGKTGRGIILEVKKEKTISYLECILYDGKLSARDEIAIAGFDTSKLKDFDSFRTESSDSARNSEEFRHDQKSKISDKTAITKIRLLQEAMPLCRGYENKDEIHAASGFRMQVIEKGDILPGMPFMIFKGNKEQVEKEFKKELTESIKLDKEGIIVKADSLGSLEALLTLLRQAGIKIGKAGIGSISKQDIITGKAILEKNEVEGVILGFNVGIDKEIDEKDAKNIKILVNEVVYKLIEDLIKWQDEKRKEIEKRKLERLASPCRLHILHNFVFRDSKPAIFGVKVEVGKLKPGSSLINSKGEEIARVKNIQKDGKGVDGAVKGDEVAVSLPGITFSRQLKGENVLYADISEEQFRNFKKNKDILGNDDVTLLQELAQIKRKEKPTWGI